MGIVQSIKRSLEDEGGERPIYPCRRLPSVSIYNGVKALLCKCRFIVFYFRRPRKRAAPLLPLQNPESAGSSSEPLLDKTIIISSISDDHDIPRIDVREEEKIEIVAVGVISSISDDHTSHVSEDSDDDIPRIDVREEEKIEIVAVGVISSISDDHTIHVSEDSDDDISRIDVREEEKKKMKKKKKRSKKKKKIVAVGVCEEERWIKHYSSRHRILLVGDGDFSFSASLALAFLSASNIIATSLDSYAFLKNNYSDALSNIYELRSRDGTVMHEIDATKMANHALLRHLRFDRIIFNFPYAGLNNLKNLPRDSQLRRHRRLVSQFLKNAREMISENGEIHISHKTNAFHEEFKIEHVASSHRLRLIEAVKFDCLDYPGYHTKYGFGGDNNFNCNPSKTYKFGLKMLP